MAAVYLVQIVLLEMFQCVLSTDCLLPGDGDGVMHAIFAEGARSRLCRVMRFIVFVLPSR